MVFSWIFRALILLGATPVFGAKVSEIQALLLKSEWQDFVKTLQIYQKKSQGAFVPLEWIQWHKFEIKSLESLIMGVSKDLRQIQNNEKLSSSEKTEKLVMLSLAANENLRKLYQLTKSKYGAANFVLAGLKDEQRIALTPLDEVFKKTEIGQKISKDLEKRKEIETQVVEIDPVEKKITYFGRPRSDLYNDFFEAPLKPFYQVEVQDSSSGNGEIRVRSRFLDTQELSPPDLKYRAAFLRGSFFKSDYDNRYFMGQKPKGGEVFVDESGAQHFSGDGHKH
jgi:hypothetical protein